MPLLFKLTTFKEQCDVFEKKNTVETKYSWLDTLHFHHIYSMPLYLYYIIYTLQGLENRG